jgi:hypothetical protein
VKFVTAFGERIMIKETVCWILGAFFFLFALFAANRIGADSTQLDPIEVRELATVIVYALVGLALTVSGSIFHAQNTS